MSNYLVTECCKNNFNNVKKMSWWFGITKGSLDDSYLVVSCLKVFSLKLSNPVLTKQQKTKKPKSNPSNQICLIYFGPKLIKLINCMLKFTRV